MYLKTITVCNNVKRVKSLFFKCEDSNELGKQSVERKITSYFQTEYSWMWNKKQLA